MLLQMNKRAGKLDESLVKIAIRPLPILQPEFLQSIMRFVEESLVETLEVTEVMGIEISAATGVDPLGNLRALLAHPNKLER